MLIQAFAAKSFKV